MKKTKIVATISDKRCDVEFLRDLYRAGMNVVRLNTAHQGMEQALKVVENVRKVADDIAILIDTKGPEVRTMNMAEPMRVNKGDVIYLTGDVECPSREKLIHVSYPYFTDDIKKGDTFFGVVYTYANSDGDSSLHTPYSSYKAQTETDFFGVTIFGEQKFGSVGIFGSLGWLHARGDVKYASAGGDLAAEIDDDMHGDVWTADIGVRGTASFGALSLVPYAKAELTYLAPDNYAFGEPDNLRFYQFPVGVNAAWTFEAAGWELTPVVDLAVIPTAGDTKAEGKYAGERYDESFYSDGTYWRAALGISARGEHGVFGLSYRYLDGADGYKMHSFGARAEYVF